MYSIDFTAGELEVITALCQKADPFEMINVTQSIKRKIEDCVKEAQSGEVSTAEETVDAGSDTRPND